MYNIWKICAEGQARTRSAHTTTSYQDENPNIQIEEQARLCLPFGTTHLVYRAISLTNTTGYYQFMFAGLKGTEMHTWILDESI